ncbi:hypothetical protein H4582DRAFT_472883 [Lactarius indigo]|nr:hypothetical protein H4582DRAFT_472883 [Lactarius indigo]
MRRGIVLSVSQISEYDQPKQGLKWRSVMQEGLVLCLTASLFPRFIILFTSNPFGLFVAPVLLNFVVV